MTEHTVAFFVDDIPGGVRLECQKCFNLGDYLAPPPWICKSCGATMRYPDGASW